MQRGCVGSLYVGSESTLSQLSEDRRGSSSVKKQRGRVLFWKCAQLVQVRIRAIPESWRGKTQEEREKAKWGVDGCRKRRDTSNSAAHGVMDGREKNKQENKTKA